jgi:DNA repair ATPase RecN
MQNKLSNIKEEIDVLDKEVKHLEKRYNTLILKQSDYSEEIENLMTIKQNLEAELKKLSKK